MIVVIAWLALAAVLLSARPGNPRTGEGAWKHVADGAGLALRGNAKPAKVAARRAWLVSSPVRMERVARTASKG